MARGGSVVVVVGAGAAVLVAMVVTGATSGEQAAMTSEPEAPADTTRNSRRVHSLVLSSAIADHLKARRLRLHEASALLDGLENLRVLNVFVLPYLRATVYTGDRIGLAFCGGIDVATGALRKMMIGNALASGVSTAALVEQGRRLRTTPFRVVAVLFSSHPHMTDRIVELADFVSSSASSDG